MIIVEVGNIHKDVCLNKYSEHVTWLDSAGFVENKTINNTDWFIKYIENLKNLNSRYDVVVTDYSDNIVKCLDSLKIDYAIVVANNFQVTTSVDNKFINLNKITDIYCTVELADNETLEDVFRDVYKFSWVSKNDAGIVSTSNTDTPADLIQSSVDESVDYARINKNKLSLKELIEADIDITESDVRDLKATTNKLKVAMLLQAKSRLNTVLKLSSILDSLYEELVDRIESSIKTTDTASLLYTAEQISKALSETNQFIMTLITNEKIQNFFIIDNSNVINISNDRVDINKREKIRKAAEIVIDNIDYFMQGDFDNIRNPNS